jgi:hypothetical protein
MDCAVVLRGSGEGNAQTLLLAGRVKNGPAIDQAFRDLVKSLPAGDKERIKIDADQAGAVRIHRLEVQQDFSSKTRQAFGDNPAYLAIRADAAFLVLGGNGLEALKTALAAAPAASGALQLEIAMSRLAPAIALDRKDDKGTVAKAAQEAFGQERDGDRVRVAIEGGKTLQVRFSMKGGVLRFISLLDQSERAEK